MKTTHSLASIALALLITLKPATPAERSQQRTNPADEIKPQDCGYYKSVREGATGKIKSPNYPQKYPNKARCIWLLQAPENWKFRMTIPDMNGEDGEDVNGTCNDYVEVRSGAPDARQEYYECNSDTSQTFSTKSRWLWVKFQSDHENKYDGFKADWQLIRDRGNIGDISPVYNCSPSGRGVSFQCANMQCIPWAYRCDGDMDCGCTASGCDEHEDQCKGLGLTETEIISLGVTLGFVIFVPIFLGVGYIDIYIKRKAEKDLVKKIKDAKLRDKQKKMGALVVGGAMPSAPSRPTTAKKRT